MRVVGEKTGVVDIHEQYHTACREYKLLVRKSYNIEHRGKPNQVTAFNQKLEAAADRVATLYATIEEGLV